jgi:hypothetical protein
MPGFMPGIHVFLCWFRLEGVDGRDKPGHDAVDNGGSLTS